MKRGPVRPLAVTGPPPCAARWVGKSKSIICTSPLSRAVCSQHRHRLAYVILIWQFLDRDYHNPGLPSGYSASRSTDGAGVKIEKRHVADPSQYVREILLLDCTRDDGNGRRGLRHCDRRATREMLPAEVAAGLVGRCGDHGFLCDRRRVDDAAPSVWRWTSLK